MTPVTKPEAVALAEINAMRQVSDTLGVLAATITAQGRAAADHSAASTRAMERLGDKVDDMNGRLIRLEEAKHGRDIERVEGFGKDLAKRIDALEGTRDKQAGALGATGWVAKYAPWLFAIAAAALAGLGFEKGTP